MLHTILIAAVLTLNPIIPEQAPPGRIYDGAHLLNPTGLADVANEVTELEQSGTQAAVVTLADADGHGAREMARFIQSAWNLPPTSVVMVVTLKPKFVWIQPGEAYSDSIAAPDSERIARDVIAPRFRQAAFSAGLVAGLKEVNTQIHHTVAAPEPLVVATAVPASAPTIERAPAESGGGHLGLWILLGVFACVGGYYLIKMIVTYRRRRIMERFPEGEAVEDLTPLRDLRAPRYAAPRALDPYIAPYPSSSVNVNVVDVQTAAPTPPVTLSEAHRKTSQQQSSYPSYDSSPAYTPPAPTPAPSSSDSGSGSSWGGFSSDSGSGSSWGGDSGGGFDFGGGGGDGGGGSGW